ncbi:MAG: VCBS repeat-containing protein [Candidatus Lambdaproteobacteria bacterium]|nr:VCBS repeat-containing protein [Candidatus Lambdaproteobacteria bacterium]
MTTLDAYFSRPRGRTLAALLSGLAALALAAGLCAGPRPAAAQGQAVRWDAQFYGTLDGTRRLLHNDSLHFGKLALGDLDGDGDLDILVGSEDGRIAYFENTGRPGAPQMELRAEVLRAVYAEQRGAKRALVLRVLQVDGHAAPALVDIDRDGDLDLFVGTAKGKLHFFRNIGTGTLPAFEQITDQFVSPEFGTFLVPFFIDVDSDRAEDLFLGNQAGDVYFMPNQGARMAAAFCVEFPARNALPEEEPPCRPTPVRVTAVVPESNAAPVLVDYDDDGDMDLFVGKSNGTIAYYENRGGRYRPDWMLVQSRFLAIDDGGYAAPAFMDVNADGKPDLLVGSSTNAIATYTGKDTGRALDVWKVSRNFLGVERLGGAQFRLSVAAGDVDGDGDADLILGNRAGRLTWVENVGDKAHPAWRMRAANLLVEGNRTYTAPVLGDLDGDGDLDLLVGGRDGRLWHLVNMGTAKLPQWSITSNFYAGIDVGNSSIPALLDADGDGDLDLLVGNSQGLVIYYRNDGTPKAPDFVLASTRFAGIAAGNSAAPAVFDYNGDGKPDVLVGNRTGRVILALRKEEGDPADPRSWDITSRYWEEIEMKTHSVPSLADLNGDGKTDLLISDGQGNLKLWYNAGMGAAAAEAAQPPPAAVAAAGAGTGQGAPSVNLVTDEGEFAGDEGSLVLSVPKPAPSPGVGRVAEPERDHPADTETAAPAAETGPIDPRFVLVSKRYGDLEFNGRSVPAFGDVDGDGDLDLIVGTGRGSLVFVRNEGAAAAPLWVRVTDTFADYSHGRNASPLLDDLDGDGVPELLVGTERGYVLLYKRADKGAWALLSDAMKDVNAKRNAAPAVLRMRPDAKPTVLLGDLSGQILSYEMPAAAQSLNFQLVSRRFLGVDVGVSATPFVGDVDRDGTPDLLVGSDQGNVYHFRLDAAGGKPVWKKITETFKGLQFPPGTTPRLADIDGDGDQDLFLGSEQGTIYFYRNEAIAPGAGANQ